MRSSVFRVRRSRNFRSVDRRSIQPKLMVRIKFFLARRCDDLRSSVFRVRRSRNFRSVDRRSIQPKLMVRIKFFLARRCDDLRSSVFRVRRPRDFRSVDRRSIPPKLMVHIKFFLARDGRNTSSATTNPTSFFFERLSILYLLSGFVNRYTGLMKNLCRGTRNFSRPASIPFLL